ncbi:CinA family protein [Halobacterium salinarum]|uniref:CinA family protein n=1 Tax=Halobacterium salinarum TaxID=2242 RepID=UPI0025552485|nr:CinA family protein [Halobacterium salinarum]MDL0138025.1 CinA family protein [Halobacterium salinarum]
MDDSDPDPPTEQSLGDALRDAGHTVATAESCTGGLIGSLLTDVPGASAYFDRSYVTYSYDAKLDHGVSREHLDEHGAVSEPVARQMARGVRDQAGTTWGVATTGIAGPDGGTPEKPVGTAYIGAAYAGDWGTATSATTVVRREFDGDRQAVKAQIARAALTVLAAELEKVT